MVSSKQRVPVMLNVPTAAEAGYPSFDPVTFVGMLAPAGTPVAIVARLNASLQKVLREPAMIERMDACCSARLIPGTPAQFDDYLRHDREMWARKIPASGIQPE